MSEERGQLGKKDLGEVLISAEVQEQVDVFSGDYKELIKGDLDRAAVVSLVETCIDTSYPDPEGALERFFGDPHDSPSISYPNPAKIYSQWHELLVEDGDFAKVTSFFIALMGEDYSETQNGERGAKLYEAFEISNHVGKLKKEDKLPFIEATMTAYSHGLPIYFGRFFADFPEVVGQMEFSKDGLERMGDEETQVAWLQYLGMSWERGADCFEDSVPYFNQALLQDADGVPQNKRNYVAAAMSLKRYLGHMINIHREQGLDKVTIDRILSGVTARITSAIPQATKILEESLHIYDATHIKASREVHPDLAGLTAEKYQAIDGAAVTEILNLRDIFTPLCEEFSGRIRENTPEELLAVERSFDSQPKRQAYIHDREESEGKENELLETGDPEDAFFAKNVLAVMNKNARDYDGSSSLAPWNEFSHSPGKAEEYYWAKTGLGGPDHLFLYTGFPIGEYGEDFARKLTKATRVMMKLTEHYSLNMAFDISTQNKSLLDIATARGRDSSTQERFRPSVSVQEASYSSPALRALQEGIESLSGVIALLMMERIPGLETPEQALDAIVKEDFASYFSVHAPMGYIMPKVRNGRYFHQPMQVVEGEAKLSGSFVDELDSAETAASSTYFYDNGRGNVIEVKGQKKRCPAGSKGHGIRETGISQLAQAFRQVYAAME